jgi:hypothetical protein
MSNTSKLAIVAAVAAVSIASPALAQSHGEQVTGSASNREDLNSGYYSFGFDNPSDRIAERQSGVNAYAMVPRGGALYDYNPGFPGAQFGNGYNPATSGYDGGIETQR